MFDIGWSEMMVVALLALIVIGPKDLPGALRRVGQWTRKARGLAREFQGHFDDLAREADLEDARKAVNQAQSFNLEKEVENAIDPDKSIADEARDLGREMRTETTASAPQAVAADPAKDSASEAEAPPPPAVESPPPEPAPVKRRRGGAAPKVDDGATA
ncbi:MAG: Sec-independent protein translocase protein TatB [Pseudomonadota bacterium]